MTKLVSTIMLVLIGAIYGLAGVVEIEPGEVGLLVKKIGENKGMQEVTLDTGIHWYEPFIYDTPVYDVKFKQYEIPDMEAATRDGQPIGLDVSLEIGLIDNGVPNLHETVGSLWFDQIVYPAARASIRRATAFQLSDDIYQGAGRQAVQASINEELGAPMAERGINISANVRDIRFKNQSFVDTLEEKARAAQQEEIQRRYALAAEQEAIKKENQARGEKLKRIQNAEADREERRLQGEGERLKQEEIAKGILAVKTAEAEGNRLLVESYKGPGGDRLVAAKWAENLGPNVEVWGVPTGAPGTNTLVDLNSVLKGAFTGAK